MSKTLDVDIVRRRAINVAEQVRRESFSGKTFFELDVGWYYTQPWAAYVGSPRSKSIFLISYEYAILD